MAVNLNDYFEFPLEFDAAQYTAITLATLECKKTDSLYPKMVLCTNFHV